MKSTTTNTQASADEREKQHAYVEELKKRGPASFSLVAAETFVEGMRDSGYKSTGTAIDELVDNSIQAGAQRVDVIFETISPKGKQQEVGDIAVIDDGHGMEPDMIRAAVLWGGTHRPAGCQDNQTSADGDRNGLFAETVLAVWKNGKFKGDYRGFHQSIVKLMPPKQSPNYFTIRRTNEQFESQKPFTV